MSGICFNEDDSHFYFSRTKSSVLSQQAAEDFIRQYAGSQIEQMLFCIGGMRPVYDSKVIEPVWTGYSLLEDEVENTNIESGMDIVELRKKLRIQNAYARNYGKPPIYHEFLTLCRKYKISPWISVRMNDLHGARYDGLHGHSFFWGEHPEFRRAEYRIKRKDNGEVEYTDDISRALDFSNPEVRDHKFRLLEEILELFDIDGLELDWMRHGYHFRPGYEEEGAKILTEYLEDIRNLIHIWEERRGHKICLGVRVPSRPQTALQLGMDAVTWARKKLVDQIVITPFFYSIETDMPIELWKQLLSGTDVTLAAGVEMFIRAYPETPLYQMNSPETVRGAAISLLDRGADKIYLFNYLDNGEVPIDDPTGERDRYAPIIWEVGEIDTMKNKLRRHVLTYADTWAPGEPEARKLPTVCTAKGWQEFRIPIGPEPMEQQTVQIALGIEEEDKVKTLEVRLNGNLCTYTGLANFGTPGPEKLWCFTVPKNAAHRGYNVIEIYPNETVTVQWAEIAIF